MVEEIKAMGSAKGSHTTAEMDAYWELCALGLKEKSFREMKFGKG